MKSGIKPRHDSQIALNMQLRWQNKSNGAGFLFVIHALFCKFLQIGIATAPPLLKCPEECRIRFKSYRRDIAKRERIDLTALIELTKIGNRCCQSPMIVARSGVTQPTIFHLSRSATFPAFHRKSQVKADAMSHYIPK